MKTVAATLAKNILGQVFDDACDDMVMIERHGKKQIALMPAREARLGVLCAYSLGVMPRSVAMRRLGMIWYGELIDAMRAEGLTVNEPAERRVAMSAEIERMLGAA